MPRPRKFRSNAERQKAYRRRLKRNAAALRNSDEWYTPADVLFRVRLVLGRIDLDPASCADAQDIVQARRWFGASNDGLRRSWRGRVWLNPPYSYPLVEKFCAKLVAEYDAARVTEAVLLVNNATDAAWFQNLLERFPACFKRGRICFRRAGRAASSPRQGQVFFYLGANVEGFAEVFGSIGQVRIPLAKTPYRYQVLPGALGA